LRRHGATAAAAASRAPAAAAAFHDVEQKNKQKLDREDEKKAMESTHT
jgi:hypothetical protein